MANPSAVRIIELAPGEAQPALAVAGVDLVPRDTLARDGIDSHFLAVHNDRLLARCSIWARRTPRWENTPLGVIGHYAATDRDAGAAVLRVAVEQLREAGLPRAVGPMDGSTWRRYRLVTDAGTEPPFFLEPTNPPDWPAHFLAAGFAPAASYTSALNDDLSVTDPRVPAALERMTASGVRVRHIDPDRWETELAAVHELSLRAFADNFLYTPLPRDEFLAMYAPLRPHVVPQLVFLAEHDGSLVGFMFGVPDLLERQRGGPVRTAIAKTLAVRPGRTGAGVGSVLMDMFQQSARRLGFSRVIHALMHETNRSRAISTRYGHTFRRYQLFGSGLAP